jgi:hypothetical protein
VLRGFREPDLLVLVTGVLAQFPAQLAEPVEHARRDGRLRPRPVAVELLDDRRGDEQLQFALELQDAQGHDPLLSLSPCGHVKPCGRVDEQAQHEPECFAGQLGQPSRSALRWLAQRICRFRAMRKNPPI